MIGHLNDVRVLLARRRPCRNDACLPQAWVTFQIAVGDEGPDMHPKWGTILVILGWLFALIATILFTYRTKKQQDGKSTYQLEDLSGN